MVYSAEQDPLCYPGTKVLINKLNIRDQNHLEEIELALFLTRAEEPVPRGRLDAEHYKSIHHHLFQDVYDWAGKFRTIRIGKGGNWFCYPEHIESEMERLFNELAQAGYLTGIGRELFAAKAAHFIAELNAIHPFREGNGRTQLTFLIMLVENAGFWFNDDVLVPELIMEAMIESFAGSEESLIGLVYDLASD